MIPTMDRQNLITSWTDSLVANHTGGGNRSSALMQKDGMLVTTLPVPVVYHCYFRGFSSVIGINNLVPPAGLYAEFRLFRHLSCNDDSSIVLIWGTDTITNGSYNFNCDFERFDSIIFQPGHLWRVTCLFRVGELLQAVNAPVVRLQTHWELR